MSGEDIQPRIVEVKRENIDESGNSTGFRSDTETITQVTPEQAIALCVPPIHELINLGPLGDRYPVGLPEMLADYVNARGSAEAVQIHCVAQIIQENIDIKPFTQDILLPNISEEQQAILDSLLKTKVRVGDFEVTVADIRAVLRGLRYLRPIENCFAQDDERTAVILLPVPSSDGKLVLVAVTQPVFADLVRNVFGPPAVFPPEIAASYETVKVPALGIHGVEHPTQTSRMISGHGLATLIRPTTGNRRFEEVGASGTTAQGRRESQEDAFAICPVTVLKVGQISLQGLLLSLADGMGRNDLGELAAMNSIDATLRAAALAENQKLQDTLTNKSLLYNLLQAKTLTAMQEILQNIGVGGEDLWQLLELLSNQNNTRPTERLLVLRTVIFMRSLIESQNHDVLSLSQGLRRKRAMDENQNVRFPGSTIAQALVLSISSDPSEFDVCVGHCGDSTVVVLNEEGAKVLETVPHNYGAGVSRKQPGTTLDPSIARQLYLHLGADELKEGSYKDFLKFAPLVEYVRVNKGARVLVFSDGLLSAFKKSDRSKLDDRKQKLFALFSSDATKRSAVLQELGLKQNISNDALSRALVSLAIAAGDDNATLLVAET